MRKILRILTTLLPTTARVEAMTTCTVSINAEAGDVSVFVIDEMLIRGIQRVMLPDEAPAGESTQLDSTSPIESMPLGSSVPEILEDETVHGGGEFVISMSDETASSVEVSPGSICLPETDRPTLPRVYSTWFRMHACK